MVHQVIARGLTDESLVYQKRLVGQAVKTPASHAGNAGSIPARVTKVTSANIKYSKDIYTFL